MIDSDPTHSPGVTVKVLEEYNMKRGMLFGGIIVAAMLAFELFNYTTTDFALADLLGDLRFLGLRWAMILAVAFCAMDFAGIARLFTAERGRGERVEVWYLLGAWFLAATMNAMLTWWGVSLALLRHPSLGNEILSRDTLLAGVPVFVAILVWLIRILLIGMMSMMGERLFSQVGDAMLGGRRESQRLPVPATATPAPRPTGQMAGPLPQGIRPATLAPAAHLPRTQVPGSAGVKAEGPTHLRRGQV